MRPTRILTALAAVLLLGLARTAAAQTPGDLFAQGVASYRALDYDNAALLFRRALSASGGDALDEAGRAQVALYLGAAEVLRGQRASAENAFRLALRSDPRSRADSLVFPPEVGDVFAGLRRRTAYVRLVAPADTTFAVGTLSFGARVYASAPHSIEAVVTRENGELIRTLYSGPIGDSTVIQWDGLAATKLPIDGALVLQITSKSGDGQRLVTRLPLEATIIAKDTLPLPSRPAESAFLPERRAATPAVRGLVAGLVVGAAAVTLPLLVAQDGKGTPARIAVGGSLGVAGLLAYLSRRPGSPLDQNVAANRATREAWQRESSAVHAENDRRRRDVKVRLRARQDLAAQREELR